MDVLDESPSRSENWPVSARRAWTCPAVSHSLLGLVDWGHYQLPENPFHLSRSVNVPGAPCLHITLVA